MKRFYCYAVLAIMALLALAAGRREYIVGTVPSNSVIWIETYSPMFFDPTSFTVYPDGTVLRGTNSYSVNTQRIHTVCGELQKIGFFEIHESALRRKLDDIQEATGRHLATVDYETTTVNVSYQGRSNQITWKAIVSYADAYPEIPEFKTLSRAFHMIRTNFAVLRRP
jgi:hypothetical protein